MTHYDDIKKVTLIDDSIEYIDSPKKIIRLINNILGNDVAEYVESLYYYSCETNRRIDTDLIAYEATLEEYNNYFGEIEDIVNYLIKGNRKRMNKEKLFKELAKIKEIIINR
ncbi:MAG: hypothetical protein M0Q88_08705 [Bacilli bacterium]|nr:hypothetical protein [Bacilli bacterium]